MDLDAHIRTLLNFKRDIEKVLHPHVLERLIVLAEALPASDVDVHDLKKHVDELAETVTGLQQAIEKIPEMATAALADALKPLQGRLDAVDRLADPAVIDLLDWLARNREGIDVLLSIGEDSEEPSDGKELDPDGKPATGADPVPDGKAPPPPPPEQASS